ncbi:putative D-amino acid oxidase [Exophiala viscosa]|uniref:D-amino acid oxidase n=1 Tax=Exophiala viscosa TaxID=2486360 RepID=A0AAN6DR98_9EURO|nr:putative D-amino acid oxidase [Exophiala viscosa]
MPKVCVLGSGIIGLASAECLANAGFDVVVVARDLPGDAGGLSWASPSAGAVIYPTHSPEAESQTFEKETFQHFWALAHQDPTSGAQVLPVTEFFQEYHEDMQAWYMKVNPHYRHLRADELPHGVKVGVTVTTIAVNPIIYLPYLQRKLEEQGATFVRFEAHSLEHVLRMTGADVLVNATGLGAKKLCNDDAVVPIRGQAMFLRNRPGWNQILLRQDAGYTYVIPRLGSGGVLFGGIRQEGNEGEAADPALRKDILERVNHLSRDAFADVNLETDVEDMVGFRPGRKGGYRLEIEGSNLIHAYGFDGVGYVCSFGAGRRVTEMVKQLTDLRSKL